MGFMILKRKEVKNSKRENVFAILGLVWSLRIHQNSRIMLFTTFVGIHQNSWNVLFIASKGNPSSVGFHL
jgi:hypothetical protein